MKSAILFSFVVFGSFFSTAQCNITVSSNSTSGMYTGDTISQGVHHICFNSYLSYYGNSFDTLYLEDQVTLDILWSDNLVVYADTGAAINYSGTGNNVLLAIYYDSTVTSVDTAGLNIVTNNHCAGFNYDYSAMTSTPDFNCTLSNQTANVAEIELNEFKLFPNPFTSTVSILASSNQKLTIFSAHGQVVYEIELTKGAQTIDLSQLSNGIYFCRFENGEFGRLIKE